MVQALRREGITEHFTLGLLITNDENIKRLNLEYRAQDRTTDVLAFGVEQDQTRSASPPSVPPHLGDVVVSYPRAASQAETYGHSVEEELDRLVVHGLLHLLGYDDQGREERQTMWHRQETILRAVHRTQDGPTSEATDRSANGNPRYGRLLEDTSVPAGTKLADSFRYAFAGFWHTLKTQRNARIHLAIAVVVVAVGTLLDLNPVEWAVIGLTIGFVFVAEMFNTAFEAVIDIVTGEYHPLAKRAKDVAAGAVLVAAMTAVAVGLLVLGPRLLARIDWRP